MITAFTFQLLGVIHNGDPECFEMLFIDGKDVKLKALFDDKLFSHGQPWRTTVPYSTMLK
jgi:hypothetical protein